MSKSKYSVSVILDKRRKKINDHYPLKFRVIVNRLSFHIALGHDIEEKFWDSEKEQVSSKCPYFGNISRFNNYILKEKSRILDKLFTLNESGELERLSVERIKSFILDKSNEIKALEYFGKVIIELDKGKKHGNAKVYETARRSVSTFVNGKDFPLKQITYQWLKEYEAWYFGKGNTMNGLSVHMRTLRALMNLAIKERRLLPDYYPFKEYSIKNQETRKRAIPREDIVKIANFVPMTQRQNRAKDYFLISFYLMGASFADIAYLKLKNIKHGRIEYQREKTGKLHSIPLSTQLSTILNRYLDKKDSNDYILNIIRSLDSKQQLVEIREELKRYNRSLKVIAMECGIDTDISSYTARHSYATGAKKLGVPTAIISEALGHRTEKTTQIYLDSFENTVVDNYHEKIINLE